MVVEEGKQISIEYTLSIDPEGVVDTNVDSDPLTYVQGTQQIVPALEKALEGKAVGDTVDVSIKAKDGYGERSEEAVQEVNKSQVPEEAQEVDTVLQGRNNEGGVVNARVAEVRDETVLLDFNHPLAGKALQFSVKILDITLVQDKFWRK
jgi:FKBP-type peptidyl-prolyl cis-trans isomerase SlyD